MKKAVIALLLAACAVAAADEEEWKMPFKINGTNTFLVRSFDSEFLDRPLSEQEDSWELYNRLVLNLSRGPLLIGLQFDFDRYDLSEGDQRLEKRYIEYRGRRLKATAGDFFASFGRGTALSVVKSHELYGIEHQIDNTIDGGRIQYRGKRFSAEALAGKIFNKFFDTNDTLYGGTASYKVASWLRAGGSVVRGELEAEGLDADLASLNINLPGLGDIADITYEYTTLRASSPYANGADEGHAAYLEISGLLGDLSLTAEYKDLENFFFKYSTPPLIEEESQELISDFFAYYPEDLETYKLRGDYSLPNGTLLYAALSHFDEKATRHPSYFRYDRDIDHFYGGFEHSFENGSHLLGIIGKRWEESRGYYFQFNGPTIHGGIEGMLPLAYLLSVEAKYHFSQLDGDIIEYNRNKLELSLSRSQLFTFTAVWESSNLPGEVFFAGKEDFYFAQLDIKLLRKHLVRIFFGETRGGIKCSGGVCKYVPAFRGLRFEAVIRF